MIFPQVPTNHPTPVAPSSKIYKVTWQVTTVRNTNCQMLFPRTAAPHLLRRRHPLLLPPPRRTQYHSLLPQSQHRRRRLQQPKRKNYYHLQQQYIKPFHMLQHPCQI